MNNVNLSGFDVVVIEQEGELTITTCYKNYTDYARDKEVVSGFEVPVDFSGLIKLGGN